MKRLHKLAPILALLLVLGFVVSCTAPQKLVLTPDQQKDEAFYQRKLDFANAQKQFAEAERNYNIYYDSAKPETQAWLTANVDKLWVDANDAMNLWETAINAGETGEDEIASYQRIKSAILLKLPSLIWGSE